jgi:peptide/nickel transport system substrate-binding protein
MAGYSDILVEQWLDPAFADSLDTYPLDHERATQLLESVGFTREGGSWLGPDGQPVAFEITAPTEFTDFLASARDVSEQLNAFGFDTTVRGVPAANRPEIIEQADYTVMLDFSLISTPNHPHSSLNWNVGFGFWGNNNPESPEGTSKGMNFPWTQVDADGDEVYIPDLLAESTAGLDLAPQAEAVATLTEIFNRELPVVPLYERYTNDPSAGEPRVRGWLPDDHPVYMNNQGSDNYASIQLLQGTLQPIEGSDGAFQTSATYLQPPDISWNFYTANSLYLSFSSPAYDVSFPPLFWFSEAEQVYFASVGESYSIYEVDG